MRLTDRQQSLLDEVIHLEDPQERLALVVDRAQRSPFPPSERTPRNRVPGCASNVWLIGELRDGRCYFRSDADSPVVRGLVRLLTDFFSGHTPREIVDSEADLVEALDLVRTLSSTRRHGIASVQAAIRDFAKTSQP